jgi:hypothetical protein
MSENHYPAYDLASMVDRLAPSAGAKYRGLVAQLEEIQTLVKLTLDQERDIDVRRNVVASALHSRDPALPENAAPIGRLQAQLAQLDQACAYWMLGAVRKQSARADGGAPPRAIGNWLEGVQSAITDGTAGNSWRRMALRRPCGRIDHGNAIYHREFNH